MSSSESFEDPEGVSIAVRDICPRWCVIHPVGHGVEEGGDDLVHVSGAFMVKRTVLRLAVSVDPGASVQDGCVVYVGEEEYTLYQAEVLIDGLRQQLVDRGTQFTLLAQRSSDGR
jgi:hypothetical protein